MAEHRHTQAKPNNNIVEKVPELPHQPLINTAGIVTSYITCGQKLKGLFQGPNFFSM